MTRSSFVYDSHVVLRKTQSESTSLNLQTSSTLGTGKPSTHQDRLDRFEDKEVRKVIEGKVGGKRKRNNVAEPIYDNEDEGDFMDLDEPPVGSSVANPVVVVDEGFSTAPVSAPSVGSALRKNPDGSVIAPKIAKKKQKGQKVRTG